MRRETGEIAASAEALRFAFGCLRGAIGEAMRVHGGDGAMWRGRGGWVLRDRRDRIGIAYMAIGARLLGVSNEGATRWISIYGLSIQPSLVLVPVLAIGFAAPDRAMAGALAAGLAALALPDVQPAMPFVDQILFTAFAVHPLAG
eukprot:tig00001467_g8755.t1